MSAYNEDEGNAPAYQISAVTCTDVSSKPSFTALRKPTVSNFQSSNHSSLNSELTTKESYSWNPEKMKNAYKVKQSYFNQIDIFQNNEDLLREKSEVIMGRIRETLQQHAAEESDKDNNDDDDNDETEPTSFFQTDVPEESLERARHRNLVLGEELTMDHWTCAPSSTLRLWSTTNAVLAWQIEASLNKRSFASHEPSIFDLPRFSVTLSELSAIYNCAISVLPTSTIRRPTASSPMTS